jgi:hypothetical protein
MTPPHHGVCGGLHYATSFKSSIVSYRDLSLTVCSYYFSLRQAVFNKIVKSKRNRGQNRTDTNQNYSFPVNRYTPSISKAGLIEVRPTVFDTKYVDLGSHLPITIQVYHCVQRTNTVASMIIMLPSSD